MYMTVEKNVKKVQRTEVSFSILKEFWKKRENRAVILLIYNQMKLSTLLSYTDFLSIKDEGVLQFYLRYVQNNKIWGDCDAAEISEALEMHPFLTYLIMCESSADKGGYYFAYQKLEAEIDVYVKKCKECLEDKNITVFRVNIPMIQEIEPDKGTNSSLSYVMYSRLLPAKEFRLPENIDKITNFPYSELKTFRSMWFQRLGRGSRKIYLVGPCIVAGTENPPGERLGDILYQKMQDLGLCDDCEIEFVPLQMDESMKLYNILEYDISSKDLVIFIHYNLYEYEIDMASLYNSWSGEKWLYQDKPIHTTVTGNEQIADVLIEKIIGPFHAALPVNEINMWKGEPQFAPTFEFEIRKYVEKIQTMRELPQGSSVGSIVMNCNPFTNGHRYLIEYAAKQVDYLYIFAVEEDMSVIPFCDRYVLIREGTRDIPNIILVPSGKFIISRVTFYSYFQKDMYADNINSEEDVYIFARYIAKNLGITKRFVGEEPTDMVTNSYNQKMKEVLPKYGIELIEIPRKRVENGKIISASTVRSLLFEEQWSEISRFVPPATLEYLKNNRSEIKRRYERKKRSADVREGNFSGLVNHICSEEKVVIYTIGEDTNSLLRKIPRNIEDRLVFADKTAGSKNIVFRGKQVIAPEELLTTYKEYTVIVSSVKFGPDIYRQFLQMGMDMSRCIFNTRVI